MENIYIGTSGYYFKDWPGPVYPEHTKPADMFREYVNLGLNSVELNVTFYRMPDEKLLKSFAERAPENFKYIIKAYKGITHEQSGLKAAEQFRDIYSASDVKSNFSGILLQYPESYHFSEQRMDSISKTAEVFGSIPVFVELRGSDWNNSETLHFLKEHRLNYVAVDLPQLKNLHRRNPVVTGDFAYMRLHGRNMKWYNPETRYLYDYSDDELNVFADELKSMHPLKGSFMFFNNCHGGYAALNAVKMMKKIKGES